MIHLPSRLTRALIASWALRASIALPAWCSSQNPIAALATSKSRMMKKSGQCRSTPDRITATSIIQGMGPQKYESSLSSGLAFCSAISLGPYWVRRFSASACVRPSGDVSRRLSTSGKGRDFRSSFAAGPSAGFDAPALDRVLLDAIADNLPPSIGGPPRGLRITRGTAHVRSIATVRGGTRPQASHRSGTCHRRAEASARIPVSIGLSSVTRSQAPAWLPTSRRVTSPHQSGGWSPAPKASFRAASSSGARVVRSTRASVPPTACRNLASSTSWASRTQPA